MRFIADENFPGGAVAALRAAGQDVAWVRTDAPGSTDQLVLERAVAEARILVTFDKDFGELAWRFGLPAHCGVVLFRVVMPNPTEVGTLITNVLVNRSDWPGHFSVVEPGRVRMRPLPVRSK
jgi:predicted nuclease of predicted toxin-antitoxin system